LDSLWCYEHCLLETLTWDIDSITSDHHCRGTCDNTNPIAIYLIAWSFDIFYYWKIIPKVRWCQAPAGGSIFAAGSAAGEPAGAAGSAAGDPLLLLFGATKGMPLRRQGKLGGSVPGSAKSSGQGDLHKGLLFVAQGKAAGGRLVKRGLTVGRAPAAPAGSAHLPPPFLPSFLACGRPLVAWGIIRGGGTRAPPPRCANAALQSTSRSSPSQDSVGNDE
jgi:hypothetical protein